LSPFVVFRLSLFEQRTTLDDKRMTKNQLDV